MSDESIPAAGTDFDSRRRALKTQLGAAEATGDTARVNELNGQLKELDGERERFDAAQRRAGSTQAPQGRSAPQRSTTEASQDAELTALRQQAADLGVKVDGRWSADRLREEITKARKS